MLHEETLGGFIHEKLNDLLIHKIIETESIDQEDIIKENINSNSCNIVKKKKESQ